MTTLKCPYYTNSIEYPRETGWIDQERDYSFAEINELVCRYQVYLNSLKLNPNDSIALDSENTPRFLACLFAAQRNKLRTVILGNFSNPNSRKDAIERSHAKSISLDEAETSVNLETNFDTTELNYELNHQNVAIVLFTSGSTGKEKGVCLTIGNLFLSAEVSNECTKLDQNSNWLSSLTFARIGGLAIVYRCAIASASITFSKSLSGNELLNVIKEKNISHASLVPVQLEELIEDETSLRELRKLRAILLGGAPASQKLLDAIVRLELPVLTTYGMTETTSHISLASLDDPYDRVYTSGKILKHSEVKLLNISDHSEILKGNTKGLLFVKGNTVSQGYIDEVGLEKFSTDGWYNTGDIAYLDENDQLNIVGRSDDMIISGGENIHLREIEIAAEKMEGIKEAAAIGVDHIKWGQRPILFVVAPTIEIDSIFQFLKDSLSKIKVPDRIIYLEEIPRISIGKVDYQILKKMVESDGNNQSTTMHL